MLAFPYFISLSLLKEVSSLIFVLCILLISCFLVRRIRAFLDQLLRCKSIASK
jgi:flagellar biogenesis protein FliO